MTTAQLGKRVGVSQPRAVQMEQGENDGSITLESLRRAARALDCELVYAFIPNQPLEALVRKRAQILASKHMRSVSHSMALEEQRVGERQEQQQLERLVEKLLAGRGSKLWEEATSD